ncbi:response regulator [Alicyclobacillus ferrooxydans]|uniref:Chemotaxis protein CheY n=1 Tax=Alicyclobacillus ferrooxydans TaxID=471514 RepID=A0A0P9GRU9_9BACL|nr:response regulator transcription factor [Alicyclobacillus ferrooxydans]KPV43761.1 hypothetical protein AN477_10230 [Alicyclobacillus ferrooxydans]
MQTTPYQIMIADDSERARKAVRIILESDEHFVVQAEAVNGQDAIVKARQYHPDLILMDINMPDMSGLEVTRIIKQELPDTRIVILSVSDDAADLFDAIRSGAQGYLVKRLEPEDWIMYLYGVLDDETRVPREMAEKLLAEFRAVPSPKTDAAALEQLTTREREIIDLVCTGATNKDIANMLFIAENTVKNHLKNIMAKLYLQSRVQLILYAQNLAKPDEK